MDVSMGRRWCSRYPPAGGLGEPPRVEYGGSWAVVDGDYAQYGPASGNLRTARSAAAPKLGPELELLLEAWDGRGRQLDRNGTLRSPSETNPMHWEGTEEKSWYPHSCNGRYGFRGCASDETHAVVEVWTCDRIGCLQCASGNSSRRGERVMRRTGGRGFRRFIVTTPIELREAIGQRNQRAVAMLLTRCLEHDLGEIAGKRGLRIGAQVAMHPEGEKTGEGVWLPHWEVFVAGAGLYKGHVKALPLWINEGDLAAIRADLALVWSALAAQWGIEYDADGANVWYEYAGAPGQGSRVADQRHAYRYGFRTFPRWDRGGWTFRALKYGLAAPRCSEPGIGDWRAAVAWTPPDPTCPDCGSPMLDEVLPLRWDIPGHAELIALLLPIPDD